MLMTANTTWSSAYNNRNNLSSLYVNMSSIVLFMLSSRSFTNIMNIIGEHGSPYLTPSIDSKKGDTSLFKRTQDFTELYIAI